MTVTSTSEATRIDGAETLHLMEALAARGLKLWLANGQIKFRAYGCWSKFLRVVNEQAKGGFNAGRG